MPCQAYLRRDLSGLDVDLKSVAAAVVETTAFAVGMAG